MADRDRQGIGCPPAIAAIQLVGTILAPLKLGSSPTAHIPAAGYLSQPLMKISDEISHANSIISPGTDEFARPSLTDHPGQTERNTQRRLAPLARGAEKQAVNPLY
jgi:hypothetical protein